MTEPQAWPIKRIDPKGTNGEYPVVLDGAEVILYRTADELAAAGITPPADPINFDTMPVGTVVWDGGDMLVRLPGGWAYNPPEDDDEFDPYHTEPWLSPPPAPTTCPTCGSDDPAVRLECEHSHFDIIDTGPIACPDLWHNRNNQ